jgi:hypothetical protein
MFYNILKQVEKDFSERIQWESFIELIGYKDNIRDAWFGVLKSQLNSCFAVEDIVENWGYVTYGIWDYRWFINEFGPESFCLFFDSMSLHLWANKNYYNLKKISQLLNKKNYIPIKNSFDRIDEINDENNEWKIIERGNFIFGDANDGNFNFDQLSWYARFKTKEFASQIKEKINKFRKNEEVTNLLIEINKLCKLK